MITNKKIKDIPHDHLLSCVIRYLSKLGEKVTFNVLERELSGTMDRNSLEFNINKLRDSELLNERYFEIDLMYRIVYTISEDRGSYTDGLIEKYNIAECFQ